MENFSVGLINISNGDKISKFELLKLFKKYLNKEIGINPVEGKEIDKSLSSERDDFKYIVPSYPRMVQEMKMGMEENRDLYRGIYNF